MTTSKVRAVVVPGVVPGATGMVTLRMSVPLGRYSRMAPPVETRREPGEKSWGVAGPTATMALAEPTLTVPLEMVTR
jgi:hypothetical protein